MISILLLCRETKKSVFFTKAFHTNTCLRHLTLFQAFVWCLKSSTGNEAIKHQPASDELDAPESITSVDFAPCLVSGRFVLSN